MREKRIIELPKDLQSLPMTIDGTSVHHSMFKDKEFVTQLIKDACSSPVIDEPLAGKTAIVHRDELSTNIIPWAATGALKNLVILLEARQYIVQHHPDSMQCFCLFIPFQRLSGSEQR